MSQVSAMHVMCPSSPTATMICLANGFECVIDRLQGRTPLISNAMQIRYIFMHFTVTKNNRKIQDLILQFTRLSNQSCTYFFYFHCGERKYKCELGVIEVREVASSSYQVEDNTSSQFSLVHLLVNARKTLERLYSVGCFDFSAGGDLKSLPGVFAVSDVAANNLETLEYSPAKTVKR